MKWNGENKLERVYMATLVRCGYLETVSFYDIECYFLLNKLIVHYLTCVMAGLMKNQLGLHYPGMATNFFFDLEV